MKQKRNKNEKPIFPQKLNTVVKALTKCFTKFSKADKLQYTSRNVFINPRSLEKIVTRSLEGGGTIGPPPPLLLSTELI